MPTWRYEPDENPKRKHHWDRPYCGFQQVGQYRVGKCPADMTMEEAERILNTGVPYFPQRWPRDYPARIYCVHDGCVYRAMPTNPGRSYHGFPERPDELRKLPTRIKEAILQRAEELACRREVERWMNQ